MQLKEWGKTNQRLLKRGFVALLLAAVAFFLSYFWAVAYEPDFSKMQLLTGTFLALEGFALAVWCALHFSKTDEVCRTVLLIALAGLAFVFILPPLQSPDETSHFARIYAISTGEFSFDGLRRFPDEVNRLYTAFPTAYFNDWNQSIGHAFEQYDLWTETGKTADLHIMGESSYFLIWPYLPQAFFMAISRFLGCGLLGQMYASRLANVLIYAVLCYPALKNCSRYRSVVQSVMLLPVGLQVVAGGSYDSWLLSSAFLIFSYFAKEAITRKDLPFMMLSLFPCYIKPPQMILVFIWFLIPQERWHMETKTGKRISPWLVVSGAAVLILALYILLSFMAAWNMTNVGTIERWNPDVSVSGQISFVLKNFLRTIAVFWFTLYENLFFLDGLGKFCNLDVSVPLVALLSIASLLFGALLSTKQKKQDTGHCAIGLTLFGILYVGVVMAGLYVTWTPVGMVRVIGLQARYFFPCLPAFLAALSWVLQRMVAVSEQGKMRVRQYSLWVPFITAAVSAILLFQHCFIGPFNRYG